MIRVGGKPVAYTLAEAIDAATVVVHVEKGHPDHKGVYQAIHSLFVSGLPESVLWINREQDLGDEGLRKAKLSYNPAGFIQKCCCMLLGL
jgi:hypothetical protein